MSRKVTAKALLKHAPLPSLGGEGDKERRGSVLVVGGGGHVPGGAMLTGLGALRAGQASSPSAPRGEWPRASPFPFPRRA